jgi:hypothetical protein
MGRYLSGLCAAGLGLCGGGWLIVTAVLVGGAPSDATLVTLATGAGVALVSVVALGCWSLAWRQRMRSDGVLRVESRPPSPRQARRSRRALRREMRRAAKKRARRGPGPEAPPGSGRPARSARPDTGLTGLGLAGTSIAHLVPDPRTPVTPAAAARGGERKVPATGPPVPAPPVPAPPVPAVPVPAVPVPAADCPAASAAVSAVEAATLVAELRAILEPLLAASGEGEEAW